MLTEQTPSQKAPQLTGLVAATFTPFDRKGDVDLTGIERYADWLIKTGVHGVFVCGTTGEGPSLSTDERKQVAQRWVDVVRGRMKVVVHVGHNSLPDARALASHAQEIHADATAAVAPGFFKPVDAGALTAWCAAVASASPALPFYYYHIPAMSGVSIPVTTFLETAADQIPNLAGVKFTHESLYDLACAQRVRDGRFELLFGRDEMLLSSLAYDVRGAVGSTYNFAAKIYSTILSAHRAGDSVTARTYQDHANAMIQIMSRHGGLTAAKAIMAMVGVDCGPVRLPLRSLTPEQCERLQHNLTEVGFFDLCR